MYTSLHEELRVRENQRGQRKADNAHFKTKAKPHTEDEVEGGLIIFFLSLEGNLGLTWKQPWRRQNLAQPTRRHRQNIWRVLTMGLCVCSVSWSLVPVGLHMHLWASLSLPEWGCASLFVCPTACVCVLGLCECPCAHVLFVRVGGCRFIGWAHLWSQAAVDSKVISLSSESLPAWLSFLIPFSCQAVGQSTAQVSLPLSLCLNPIFLHLCLCLYHLSENILHWPPPKLNFQYDSINWIRGFNWLVLCCIKTFWSLTYHWDKTRPLNLHCCSFYCGLFCGQWHKGNF